MKICDRCEAKTIALVLINSKEGTHYELCEVGAEEFREFMKMRCKRKGRRKKNGT